LADRRGDILFIDARSMGTMLDRTERILTDGDIARIADTYHAWRGTASARAAGLKYEDILGFCYSANLEEVREQDYILTAGRYVGAPENDDTNEEPIAEKIDRLTKELFAHFDESARLEQIVRQHLAEVTP
jgi:type I restriction enzyme M protein